jgi:TP901 family phage tail tape measure protein
MTAIWNNFYDGSASLEHYADVLTALGETTASSTEEIAGGLAKFAAIADTIGLSYEYAASALATLTSNTRESEEVVGTALKTIFARIQGLSLGETLDDGTTLNKYSQALATVGIDIKNASGQLKDMDQILDELGSKWDLLSRSQQTALAQTVAGTRQYNQLIALMANWNNGDNDSF